MGSDIVLMGINGYFRFVTDKSRGWSDGGDDSSRRSASRGIGIGTTTGVGIGIKQIFFNMLSGSDPHVQFFCLMG